jgi:alpha-L-rhamnosidase
MPGWSDYRKRVQVLTTDVTKLLQPGPNRFGAILGDGWYCGYLLWKKDRNFYGKHPQLLARLEIELISGRLISIVTDRTWELRYGPILSADLYDGESYDARKEISRWCEPNSPTHGWRRVNVLPKYRGILQPKVNETVRITQTLPTRKITRPAPGVYVFDFGQNLSGVCRLQIRVSHDQRR